MPMRACTMDRFRAFWREIETVSMQRQRATAIAITQRQALRARLIVASGLLLSTALLLLLISP